MATRRRYTGEFKAKVSLEALRGDKTIQEIAARHKVHSNQMSAWKQRAVEGLREGIYQAPRTTTRHPRHRVHPYLLKGLAIERPNQVGDRPQIFNTDQGSQFTSIAFTDVLKDGGIAISMDGRGRCLDNIFIKRLWRSLKYEAVYLHELADGFATQRVTGTWISPMAHRPLHRLNKNSKT